jgi:hypothetical protein
MDVVLFALNPVTICEYECELYGVYLSGKLLSGPPFYPHISNVMIHVVVMEVVICIFCIC